MTATFRRPENAAAGVFATIADDMHRRATTKKIVTHNIFPPIPTRSHDWCAYFDGEEELGDYGYGATEAEAVADLLGGRS